MEAPILNAHNKEEYPPMHTAEHILNGTMVRLFGCPGGPEQVAGGCLRDAPHRPRRGL